MPLGCESVKSLVSRFTININLVSFQHPPYFSPCKLAVAPSTDFHPRACRVFCFTQRWLCPTILFKYFTLMMSIKQSIKHLIIRIVRSCYLLPHDYWHCPHLRFYLVTHLELSPYAERHELTFHLGAH